jgi:hypothetical protein
MTKDDPRKVVGGKVEAKAHKVTHSTEAKRRYGSKWNEKVIPGVVVAHDRMHKPGNNPLGL